MPRKTNHTIAVFGGLLAVALSAGVPAHSGPLSGFTTSPGQISYNYQSPNTGINADVQVGNNVSTTVNQNSAHNISGIVQVGNTTNAGVVQSGALNRSAIGQYGHVNNASVIQFGNGGSMLGAD